MKARTRAKGDGQILEAVLGNTDLLTQILLCLPAKSLIRFKSISKAWLSLISDPRFFAMKIKLTQGAIPRIRRECYRNDDNDQIILQVIDFCALESDGFGEAYGLVVSDGIHFQRVTLHPSQNKHIHSKSLQFHSVIRLKRSSSCSAGGVLFIFMVDLEVILEKWERIGEPKFYGSDPTPTEHEVYPANYNQCATVASIEPYACNVMSTYPACPTDLEAGDSFASTSQLYNYNGDKPHPAYEKLPDRISFGSFFFHNCDASIPLV